MISTLLALGLGAVPAANAVTLALLPEQGTIQAGGTARIDVVASGLSDSENGGAIGGYDISVAFDPALLSWTSTTFGSGLNVTDFGDIQDSGLLPKSPRVVDTAETRWMPLPIWQRYSPTPSCCSLSASPALLPAPARST